MKKEKLRLISIDAEIDFSKSKITSVNIGFGLFSLFLTILFSIVTSFIGDELKNIWTFIIIFIIVSVFLYKIINDFANAIVSETKKQKELYKEKIIIHRKIESKRWDKKK